MALDLFRPRRAVIDWTPVDAAVGFAAADSMLAGRNIWTKDHAGHAVIEFATRAELTRLFALGVQVKDLRQWAGIPVLGATDKELDEVPDEVAAGYRATRRTLTSLVATARHVSPDAPTIDVPATVPGVVPIIIALTVVGVAAVVGTTWFAIEASQDKVELEKHRITVLSQVDLYLKDLQARIAAGAPLPDPPSPVVAAAEADSVSGPIMLGAGLLLGAAAVGGAVYALRKPSAPTYATNPARPRLRSSARRRSSSPRAAYRRRPSSPRSSAAPAPARKKNARRRRKANPLQKGYSRATVSRNIARERKAGRPAKQAAAMSLRSARAEYRQKHPTGPLPKHLKPTKRANPKRPKVVVRPHKRASAKCAVCGKVHDKRQHWSHKFAAKKGPAGGSYRRKRASKERVKKKAATRRKRPVVRRKRTVRQKRTPRRPTSSARRKASRRKR